MNFLAQPDELDDAAAEIEAEAPAPARRLGEGCSILVAACIAMSLVAVWAGIQVV